jgi:hypothetical protein
MIGELSIMNNLFDLKISPNLSKIINGLVSALKSTKKYATFHKIANHVHTPQSYDYDLLNTGKKKRNDLHVPEGQLINLAQQYGILRGPGYSFKDFQDNIFDTPEEELKFLIQAKKIVDEEIEAIIVTDHNRIDGFKKMRRAMQILKDEHVINKRCSVILGIEISCADKNHVVGIFDGGNNESVTQLNNWINDFVMDEESGTYKSTIDVLNDINRMGGIGYIAHMNSSDLLFGKHSLSEGYKKQLFNLPFMKLIGLKDIGQAQSMLEKISYFRIRKEKLSVIIDEDSHTLDDLGTKTFWIKGEQLNFKTIKSSLRDFELNTKIDEDPAIPENCIKAFYVSGNGFLKAPPGTGRDDFSFQFSERMNSFIGGRGTGKSTILDMLDLLLSQQVYDVKTLRNLLNQGTMAALVHLSGSDYYIVFNSSSDSERDKNNNETLIEEYTHLLKDSRNSPNQFENRNARKVLIRKRIQVFRRVDDNIVEEITSSQKLLDQCYTRQFSIHRLVDIASGNELSTFVLSLLNNSAVIKQRRTFRQVRNLEDVRSRYQQIPQLMKEREKNIMDFLNDFNNSERKQLELKYSQKRIKDINFPWVQILTIYSHGNIKRWFKDFNISSGNLVRYLEDLSQIIDPFQVIFLLLDSQFKSINQYLKIEDYLEINAKTITDQSLKRITEQNNKENFFKEIKRLIYIHEQLIIDALLNFLNDYDEFYLYFNINNKANYRTQGARFVDVSELSMGQKVVAMMSFILAYDNYTGDFNPLVIDQPEDNLDNQYIYDNLVQDLREIKGRRQVIIASHNSTIVVNAGTEQVIVMESDGKNGWIDKTGYSMEKTITQRIISILEGGETAFRRKVQIYNIR